MIVIGSATSLPTRLQHHQAVPTAARWNQTKAAVFAHVSLLRQVTGTHRVGSPQRLLQPLVTGSKMMIATVAGNARYLVHAFLLSFPA